MTEARMCVSQESVGDHIEKEIEREFSRVIKASLIPEPVKSDLVRQRRLCVSTPFLQSCVSKKRSIS